MLFVMNVLSSRLHTQMHVAIEGNILLAESEVELAPMEVKTLFFEI